jgi:hypothetical protein
MLPFAQSEWYVQPIEVLGIQTKVCSLIDFLDTPFYIISAITVVVKRKTLSKFNKIITLSVFLSIVFKLLDLTYFNTDFESYVFFNILILIILPTILIIEHVTE